LKAPTGGFAEQQCLAGLQVAEQCSLSKRPAAITPCFIVFLGPGGGGLRNPRGALSQGPDGILYGTATAGGASGFGGVFKLQTNGSGFQVLHEFSSTGGDGRAPEGGVTIGGDGYLYGVTRFGGGAVNGSIFRLNTNGNSYGKLRALSGTNREGGNPIAGLIRGVDGALFGTTSAGGELGFGTLFRILPDSAQPPLSIQMNGDSTIQLVWPESAGAFYLESNIDLANPLGWGMVTTSPVPTNGEYSVTLPTSNTMRFFRLTRP
jgi:uncharacterized repeat protein (TIGR03803 family)